MVKKTLFVVLSIVVVLVLAGFSYYHFFVNKDVSFTKTSLIKLNIPLGGEFSSNIKISNPDKFSQNLKVYLEGFSGLASISENDFYLDSREQKELEILFNDENNVAKTYAGKLVIEGKFSKDEVPVVVGVEDPHSIFAIIQSSLPKYDSVYPGGKLGVEIKVYDLVGLGLQTVYAEYEIRNLEGEVLKTGNSDLVVGSGSKTELFDIPVDWNSGDYVLIVSIDYEDSVSFSSYVFRISKKTEDVLMDSFILLVVIILVFVLGVLALIFYFIRVRDSFLLQLRSQQTNELKSHVKYVNRFKKEVSKSKEDSKKKKEKLRKLNNVKKSLIKKIKNKQKSQRKEVSKLRKKKNKKAIERKLRAWENESHKMEGVDKEVKKAIGKGIKSQIKDWNKKGLESKK